MHATCVATRVNNGKVVQAMPRESAEFPHEWLCDDPDPEYEWRVERLGRKTSHHGVWTDARVVRCKENGTDRFLPKLFYVTSPGGSRTDLAVEVPPLGHSSRRALFHRVVAFAWKGDRCGHVNRRDPTNGTWKPLNLEDWSDFDPRKYQVDHGGGVVDTSVRVTTAEVFIDRLAIVTPERNRELEVERHGWKRRRLK